MNRKHRIIHFLKHSFFFSGLLSIAWFLFRTGSKPSRATYPCQQLAAATGYLWIMTYLGVPLAGFILFRKWVTPGRMAALLGGFLLLGTIFAAFYATGGGASAGSTGPMNVEGPVPANNSKSSLFIAQGYGDANESFKNLLQLMRDHGLEFYQTSTRGSPKKGLIGRDDVVIIKVNCQWPERGGTSTDLVKSVIAAILAHPDGFTGEIVVADSGQGRGSFDWPGANAEDTTQSIQKVVDSFSTSHHVSTYLWDTIRNVRTEEYDQGFYDDGYIMNTTPNPRTGLQVSYPKFRTVYGTNISFRKGVWENGAYNGTRLKLINIPVLKSHSGCGVTGSLKHYIGVVSVPLADPHGSIIYGGLGTAMVETRYPDLNILDATWVNAIPMGYDGSGPYTSYDLATRTDTVAASTDPVALDYYGARHILMPLASALEYDTRSMDPDNTAFIFGSYIRGAMQEIQRGGYNVTLSEDQMDIFSMCNTVPPGKIGVFKNGQWYMDASGNGIWEGQPPDQATNFGIGGDFPVTGDWDRDTIPEVGVFRNGQWFVDVGGYNNLWGGTATDRIYHFGVSGDIPVVGDWNGDRISEIGTYRNGVWYLDGNSNNVWDGTGTGKDFMYSFGGTGLIPVAGDWNRDGLTEIGVYGGSGTWYVDANRNFIWDGTGPGKDTVLNFGFTWAAPVTGDWNGDGVSEIGIYDDDGIWYLDANGNSQWDGTGPGKDSVFRFGAAGFTPVVGDWT